MYRFSVVLFCAITLFCSSELFGDEESPRELTLEVDYEQVDRKVFEKLGLLPDATPTGGEQLSCVLSDIESYFLKLAIQPQGRTIVKGRAKGSHRAGKKVAIAGEARGSSETCRVSILPTIAEDGKLFVLSLSTPKDSAFVMSGESKLRVPHGDTALVASSQTEDKTRILLLITPRWIIREP